MCAETHFDHGRARLNRRGQASTCAPRPTSILDARSAASGRPAHAPATSSTVGSPSLSTGSGGFGSGPRGPRARRSEGQPRMRGAKTTGPGWCARSQKPCDTILHENREHTLRWHLQTPHWHSLRFINTLCNTCTLLVCDSGVAVGQSIDFYDLCIQRCIRARASACRYINGARLGGARPDKFY